MPNETLPQGCPQIVYSSVARTMLKACEIDRAVAGVALRRRLLALANSAQAVSSNVGNPNQQSLSGISSMAVAAHNTIA